MFLNGQTSFPHALRVLKKRIKTQKKQKYCQKEQIHMTSLCCPA